MSYDCTALRRSPLQFIAKNVDLLLIDMTERKFQTISHWKKEKEKKFYVIALNPILRVLV
jgi:hypothetical protein